MGPIFVFHFYDNLMNQKEVVLFLNVPPFKFSNMHRGGGRGGGAEPIFSHRAQNCSQRPCEQSKLKTAATRTHAHTRGQGSFPKGWSSARIKRFHSICRDLVKVKQGNKQMGHVRLGIADFSIRESTSPPPHPFSPPSRWCSSQVFLKKKNLSFHLWAGLS